MSGSRPVPKSGRACVRTARQPRAGPRSDAAACGATSRGVALRSVVSRHRWPASCANSANDAGCQACQHTPDSAAARVQGESQARALLARNRAALDALTARLSASPFQLSGDEVEVIVRKHARSSDLARLDATRGAFL